MILLRLPHIRILPSFRRAFFVLVAVLLILFGVWGILRYRPFTIAPIGVISHVVCRTQYGPCLSSQHAIFSRFLDNNLFFLNWNDVVRAAHALSEVKHIAIQKQLPGTLIVTMTVRTPRIAIKEVGAGEFTIVDEEGMIVYQSSSTTLPALVIDKQLETIPRDTLRSQVYFLSLLARQYGTITAYLTGETVTVVVNDTTVEVLASADPYVSAGSLHFVLTRFTMEGKKPATIDLRFNNPVVLLQGS